MQVLQKIFKFRTCSLDIDENDERWRWFRPCLLASIHQCTAPCNLRISKEEYRKDIRRLQMFLDGNKTLASGRDAARNGRGGEPSCSFEKAARLRDEIHLLETLDERGELDTHVQPEVFYIDPKKGLAGLQTVLKLDKPPRTIEGVDIAHLGGTETVASLVQFIDGLPFKPGYRRIQDPQRAGSRRLRQHPRGRRPAVPPPARRGRAVPRHPADRRRQGAAARRPGRVRRAADRSRRW